MRGKGKLVLWPEYFDAALSWGQGRRVPKNLALRGVKAEEVFRAALDLGLRPELRAGAAHPRHPWRRAGAVLVEKAGPKTRVLKDLARRMRGNRGSK